MFPFTLSLSSPLADPERRSRFDADAPSGLLLPSAHASAAQPLPAHCARPAAAVSGWIPLKPAPFIINLTDKTWGETVM